MTGSLGAGSLGAGSLGAGSLGAVADSQTPPVAMVIAGSDSGAGAGLQADLKAMSALRVFATTVVTAVTAQNTFAVTAVHPVPADIVEAQIAAVLEDFAVAAVKTGMLATTATVRLVADRAAAGELPHLVVDPVMVASSGRPLLDDDAVAAYRDLLIPHAVVVTPNLMEAAILAGVDPARQSGVDDMIAMAERIHGFGPTWVLVKGGHLPGVHDGGTGAGTDSGPETVTDILYDGTEVLVIEHERVSTHNNHGTGCSLASATAALLARGHDMPSAVTGAAQFVHDALVGAAGWHLGRGHGPLDPFGWASQ
ncbi:MAG: bifunctional hydroxymethylpyrimidine kinase/phosphomethylpyrimidine kinase [Acidimicrobiales bacterium]